MQTLFNLVNYGEKWVQVSPVDSPGELQLARKHVVVFVVVVFKLGWKVENPPRRLNGKYHVRSQCCSQLCGRAFTMFFVLFSPGSGRKLLLGI